MNGNFVVILYVYSNNSYFLQLKHNFGKPVMLFDNN